MTLAIILITIGSLMLLGGVAMFVWTTHEEDNFWKKIFKRSLLEKEEEEAKRIASYKRVETNYNRFKEELRTLIISIGNEVGQLYREEYQVDSSVFAELKAKYKFRIERFLHEHESSELELYLEGREKINYQEVVKKLKTLSPTVLIKDSLIREFLELNQISAINQIK